LMAPCRNGGGTRWHDRRRTGCLVPTLRVRGHSDYRYSHAHEARGQAASMNPERSGERRRFDSKSGALVPALVAAMGIPGDRWGPAVVRNQ
jgi:hypothetical protein